MGILLSIVALILYDIVHIVATLVMLVTGVGKRSKWYQTIDVKAFEYALNIDIFGNYQYRRFWNFALSKGGYKFGKFGETLSSCFGKKQQEKSLSILGWIIMFLVNLADISKWKSGLTGKGFHCHQAIESEELINERVAYMT